MKNATNAIGFWAERANSTVVLKCRTKTEFRCELQQLSSVDHLVCGWCCERWMLSRFGSDIRNRRRSRSREKKPKGKRKTKTRPIRARLVRPATREIEKILWIYSFRFSFFHLVLRSPAFDTQLSTHILASSPPTSSSSSSSSVKCLLFFHFFVYYTIIRMRTPAGRLTWATCHATWCKHMLHSYRSFRSSFHFHRASFIN